MSSLSHKLQWPDLSGIKEEHLEQYGLIKGVAASEGKTRDGREFTRQNIIDGAASLRGAAASGQAQITIDHHMNTLPTDYGITGVYPVGRILDAQAVSNNIDGKEVMQVEYVGKILNPQVYTMIKEGAFKGNSVSDIPREVNCTDTCKFEASTFVHNTLALKGIPSNSYTWVDIMELTDLEPNKIVEHLEEKEKTVVSNEDKQLEVKDKDTEAKDKDTEQKENQAKEKEVEKEDEPDPVQVMIDRIMENMGKLIDQKFAEYKASKQVQEHNTDQLMINHLQHELDNFGLVFTPERHAQYLDLKRQVEFLNNKKKA